ncbi:hypothetical protein [Endozoicomonas numazuensis]|uniref:DUF4352 domain-containing protein n=1 Tax=Endozoicomonas numazuensis TaxID=1137799 RepID=A0A081NM22_9GAMM|nr:hypothetical protein [Endozoicomonas numazuensis]KEQ19495.1 hypothetical protein GZ78_06085 [Endozoicomonas numazuensis]
MRKGLSSQSLVCSVLKFVALSCLVFSFNSFAEFECTVNKEGRFDNAVSDHLDLSLDITNRDDSTIAMLTITDRVKDEVFLVLIKPEFNQQKQLMNCNKSGQYGYLTYQWQGHQSIPEGMNGRIELAFSPDQDHFIGTVTLFRVKKKGKYISNVAFVKKGFY